MEIRTFEVFIRQMPADSTTSPPTKASTAMTPTSNNGQTSNKPTSDPVTQLGPTTHNNSINPANTTQIKTTPPAPQSTTSKSSKNKIEFLFILGLFMRFVV